MAGKITIAEVKNLVPAGELDPDNIHTPVYTYTAFLRAPITRKGLSTVR